MYEVISRSRLDCKPQQSSQNTAHPLLARAQHTIPASAMAVTVSSPPSAAVHFLNELAPMLGVSAPSKGPAEEEDCGGSAGAASGGAVSVSISMLGPLPARPGLHLHLCHRALPSQFSLCTVQCVLAVAFQPVLLHILDNQA